MLVSTFFFPFSHNIFYSFGDLPFNSLPNNKIWEQSNLKAIADNILNVVWIMICVTDWIENNNNCLLFQTS